MSILGPVYALVILAFMYQFHRLMWVDDWHEEEDVD